MGSSGMHALLCGICGQRDGELNTYLHPTEAFKPSTLPLSAVHKFEGIQRKRAEPFPLSLLSMTNWFIFFGFGSSSPPCGPGLPNADEISSSAASGSYFKDSSSASLRDICRLFLYWYRWHRPLVSGVFDPTTSRPVFCYPSKSLPVEFFDCFLS